MSQRISIPTHLLFQEVNEEAVLLDLERGHYFGLDEVGTRIWRLLADHSSVSAVYSALMQEGYAAEAEEIENDLGEFIRQLEAEGLIELERQT